MAVKVILGLQNGDEGKGRIVDDLCFKADKPVVVRFQGGANAGHTIYDEKGNKSVVHLLPSGVLNPNAINVITRATVVDPIQLVEEIKQFNVQKGSLIISPYCPVVMSWHIAEDKAKYQSKLGTTAKGIGPALRDFYARDAMNINAWLQSFDYTEDAVLLKDYIGDAEKFLQDHLSTMDLLLEGCQGYRLDVWGEEYPNVTSSCTTIGAVFYSTRLSHKQIDEVIGVAKIYETKVGTGEFEELDEELSEKYRSVGKEYGATTGRPRKIGWLDLDLLKEAIQVNGVDTLIITKTDIPVQVGVLKIRTAEDFWEIKELWNGSVEPLVSLLKRIQNYTGVKKIGYTYGENRGSIAIL
jgi:adenylosuccinate synthase